jgi:hypothetical protein
MALNQFIDSTLNGPISTVRRQAIGIAVAVAAAIGALFYFMAAANVALEPIVGPVASRAIIGGSFLFIAILGIAMPRMFRSQSMVERAQAETKDMTRDEKFALIVEALLAGFSLSSSRRSRTAK